MVTAPYDRQRRDPQPWGQGWEVAVIVLGGALLLTVVAALAGLSAAAGLFGGGWVWPHGSAEITRTLEGFLTGHPGQGLTAAIRGRIPAKGVVYACIAVTETATAVTATLLGVWVARYRRPGDARGGMATRSEAAAVLGARQLRAARRIIRPDLYRHGPSDRRHGAVTRFEPTEAGWRLGRSTIPRGTQLWCRYDRTAGVFGEQGSGKTLDVLAPALLAHTGAAVVTLTKIDDLLLTVGRRQKPTTPGGRTRPIAVLDPFGAAPGLPELIWDPVGGCADPRIAEKRAKAFAAGTVTGAVTGGRADNAARFYAAETAKVLQGFLHAAALTGRTLDHVLEWVANPVAAEQPAEILRQHPQAARFWDGLLAGALHGSADTVGNTVTTVQQAMSLFFQPEIRARCVPQAGRPVTDLADLIARDGTVYLLGREDPYASAAPLLTAVAEHVLDTALQAAITAPHGRITPSFLACLDELPSTAPLPTLRVRMANERALGLSFIYACQTWKQLVVAYGEDEARSLFGLTNNLIIFGGGKDIHFYTELSDLIDDVRIARQTVSDGPGGIGTSRSGEDVKVLRPGDIRRLPARHALIIAGNAPPIIARLHRCLDGKPGRALGAELTAARGAVAAARGGAATIAQRTADALAYATTHHLAPATPDPESPADAEPPVDAVPPAPAATATPGMSRSQKGWTW